MPRHWIITKETAYVLQRNKHIEEFHNQDDDVSFTPYSSLFRKPFLFPLNINTQNKNQLLDLQISHSQN